MWKFASHAIGGNLGLRNSFLKPVQANVDCSDDEVSSCASHEEGLECPICLEYFNIVENVPYVLWCGHTLCKNCVLGLEWAVMKFPTLPVQLPLFISCPWCHSLSFRLVYKGNLRFPCKNFFLLWMIESMNGEHSKCSSSAMAERQSQLASSNSMNMRNNGHNQTSSIGLNMRNNGHNHLNNTRQAPQYVQPYDSASNTSQASPRTYSLNLETVNSFLHNCLLTFVQLTAKFPLVLLCLLIVIYAIPASATVLALFILITVLFGVPAFLMLYFSYPCLDWLVREIIT